MPKSGDLLYNCKSKCLKLLRSSALKLNKRFQVRLVRSTSGVQSYTIRFPGKSGLSRLPEVPGPTAFWDRAPSSEGWEVADGVAHQSEELAGLPVLRPLRQGVSTRRSGVGLCALPAKWRRARGRRPKFRRHREVGTRPVARRTGGRTQKRDVSAPAGPARVHPQRGWQAKAAGHPLHQGPRGANGDDVRLGADLRGRLGARTTRLSPGTQRLGRRSPSRAAAQVGAYRGGGRGPLWIFRQHPPCRVNEVGVPADQRRPRSATDRDMAGSTGGRDGREREPPSNDPEQGLGDWQPSRVSDLTVVRQCVHAALCEGVEDGRARETS